MESELKAKGEYLIKKTGNCRTWNLEPGIWNLEPGI
jgi:hypothetical protein